MEAVLTDLAQKVAIAHTVVVVIDMQNDFCSEGGFLAQRGTDMTAIRSLIPRLQQFLDRARQKNVTIVFIQMVIGEEDISSPMRERLIRIGVKNRSCVKGSWGAEFASGFQPKANEMVIKKTRYSAFINTDLDRRLRDMGMVTLIITGVATNICVESTARDGFMLDYYIVVPNDLVACGNERLHEDSLFNLDRYFATITSSAEILRVWEC